MKKGLREHTLTLPCRRSAGSPGWSGRRQKELQGDGGGSTSSSSSITFSGANGATYNGVTYGNNLSGGTSYHVGDGASRGNLTLHGFMGGAADAARGVRGWKLLL